MIQPELSFAVTLGPSHQKSRRDVGNGRDFDGRKIKRTVDKKVLVLQNRCRPRRYGEYCIQEARREGYKALRAEGLNNCGESVSPL